MSDNPPPGNTSRGIGLKMLSVALFVVMAACIKAAGQLPAGQLVFFRSIFAILPILVMLAWRHELRLALYTTRPLSHFLRGLIGVAGMSLHFFALTRLPLPETITLNYTQPLMVVLFGALFLREVIRLHRWTAVILGLIGVVIISWPRLTLFGAEGGVAGDEALGVAAALGAAAVSAAAMLLVRRLVATERTSTIVMWFSLTATAASLLTLPFGWAPLSYWQLALLVTAGITGGVAQIALTQSYRHAEVSTLAPFEYTSILLGIAIGYLAFGDVPTLHTLAGSAVVVASGLFLIWREHRLARKSAKTRKARPSS